MGRRLGSQGTRRKRCGESGGIFGWTLDREHFGRRRSICIYNLSPSDSVVNTDALSTGQLAPTIPAILLPRDLQVQSNGQEMPFDHASRLVTTVVMGQYSSSLHGELLASITAQLETSRLHGHRGTQATVIATDHLNSMATRRRDSNEPTVWTSTRAPHMALRRRAA